MDVAKVELVEESNRVTGETEFMPYTFFSLTGSEGIKYNAFREKRNNLETILQGLNAQKRTEKEREIQALFIDLVSPYFNKLEIELVKCFAYYGDDKETSVRTPRYTLFEDNEPFSIEVEGRYWFSTKDGILNCTSCFYYNQSGSKSPEREVLKDILKRRVEKVEQDGYNFPMISFKGDFIYFAASDFTIPLITFIRDSLNSIGPEVMEELGILYRSYVEHNRGDVSGKLKQKVFKKAYEKMLTEELIRTGLVKPIWRQN